MNVNMVWNNVKVYRWRDETIQDQTILFHIKHPQFLTNEIKNEQFARRWYGIVCVKQLMIFAHLTCFLVIIIVSMIASVSCCQFFANTYTFFITFRSCSYFHCYDNHKYKHTVPLVRVLKIITTIKPIQNSTEHIYNIFEG